MKFLSLFAGIGGFDLGLEHAGMECIGQVENNDFCIKVLEKHWPGIKRVKDIHDVTEKSFERVGLICGGFPCQPFSLAGQRKGAADDRYLWPEMLRVIQAYRPDWVIGENVAGIVNMELDNVLADLEREDYEVQAFIIPACAVDAKHERKRVWIVARRRSADVDDSESRGCGFWNTSNIGPNERAINAPSNTGQNVSYPDCPGFGERRRPESVQSEQCAVECLGKVVSHAETVRRGEGLQNSGGYGEGTVAEEKRRGLTGGCRWESEPDVGRTLDGFSRWMDRFDLSISHKLYLTYAKETNQRPGEVLRTLRNSILSEDVQWSPGRQKCFSAKEVLLTYMCKLKAQATDKAWLQLESAEALEGAVRSLSLQNESSGASFRPTAKQQSAGEHSDALQTLSRLLAYNGKKAFVAYRRTYADSLHAWFDGWESGIERVAHGIPGRVDRMRSLGNAVVPQVVEVIGRAIIQAENFNSGALK